jgi:hypothetical protein
VDNPVHATSDHPDIKEILPADLREEISHVDGECRARLRSGARTKSKEAGKIEKSFFPPFLRCTARD